MIEEEIQVTLGPEVEERTKENDTDRRALFGKKMIDRLGKGCCAPVEGGLQLRPLLFDLGKHSQGARHGQRMFAEGAGKEGHGGPRVGIVAKPPHSSIQVIHDCRCAGYYADRQAPANHFAISDQIGLDPKVGLRTARVDAKTSNHFIKHQRDA